MQERRGVCAVTSRCDWAGPHLTLEQVVPATYDTAGTGSVHAHNPGMHRMQALTCVVAPQERSSTSVGTALTRTRMPGLHRRFDTCVAHQYAARRLVVVKDEPPKGAEGLTGHSHASPSHDGAARTGRTDRFQGGCFSQCVHCQTPGEVNFGGRRLRIQAL